MKKAKILLSAIAVFAIVGGTLAFNAKRSSFFYFTKSGLSCVSVGIVDTDQAAVAIPNVYTTAIDPATKSFPSTRCNQTVKILPE